MELEILKTLDLRYDENTRKRNADDSVLQQIRYIISCVDNDIEQNILQYIKRNV